MAMKIKTLITLMILTMTIVFTGCQNDETAIFGSLEGRVVSPSGKAVAGAIIELTDQTEITTRSDAGGRFTLSLPSGRQDLSIYTGSGAVFHSSIELDVTGGETTLAGNIILDDIGNLGFVVGEYDNIQTIIRDSLGYQVDSIAHSDLSDINFLANYDVIFLNCGEVTISGLVMGFASFTQEEVEAMKGAIVQYIFNGGNIYASDYSIGYLASMCYDTIPPLNPNNIYPDTDICFDLSGMTMQLNTEVVDPELVDIIGIDALIDYNLPVWAQLTAANSFNGNPLLRDPNSQAILAFNDQYGAGNILYTTFHNEANITEDMSAILEWYIYNF